MSSAQVGSGPQIDNPTNLPLSPQEGDVLRAMFAVYQRASVEKELSGGLGGGRVLVVRPVKDEQSPELLTVVKIARADLVRQEWEAYHNYVARQLPGAAAITDPPVFPPNNAFGGLRYTLAGEGGAFEIESLHAYCLHANSADIRYVLKERLFRVIGSNWWQFTEARASWPIQASYDSLLPVNLLVEPEAPPPGTSPVLLTPGTWSQRTVSSGDYVWLEDWLITEIDPATRTLTLNVPPRQDGLPASYRLRLQPVEAIVSYQVGQVLPRVAGRVVKTRYDQLGDLLQAAFGYPFSPTAKTLTSPYGTVMPNPLSLLPTLLETMRNVRISNIHGDLNLENILVESANRNILLIDFATARRDHTLHDLLRLETEVITKLLPQALIGEVLLVEAIDAFYQQLHKVTLEPEQSRLAEAPAGALARPFALVVTIREMARQFLFRPNDWAEYYQGLTLYLLGALKFKNLDARSKQVAWWAAAAACNILNPVTASDNRPARDWQRLQTYLPAELYERRDEASCLTNLNALLRAILTYLPRHLALSLLWDPYVAKNKGRFLEGTLLLVDISDFTAMSEKLREKGEKEGAEEMTRVINRYLDVMLDILSKRNGWLIKFGGDAMLCLFTGENQGAEYAVVAASEMRQAVASHFSKIEVLQEIFPLQLKAGSNSGLLFEANVGTAEHMEYVLTGSAVECVARAEAVAHRGDILISQETYALVAAHLEVEQASDMPDLYQVIAVHSELVPASKDPWAEIEQLLSIIKADLWAVVDRLDVLSPYLPAGVLPQLVYHAQEGKIEGQHRQVAVLFANFCGISDIIRARGYEDAQGIAADLDEYFRTMQEEVRYYGGVIDKVDLYNQGDKLMVVFGAPQAHERDVQRAALTALAMQNAMSRLTSPTAMLLSQRIGIHAGFAFAGNVGSDLCKRREYTVIGDTVNLAARLMSEAHLGQVLISQAVWEQTQGGFQASPLGPMSVKGIRTPVSPYQLEAVLDIQEGRLGSRVLDSELVGRRDELAKLNTRLADLLSGAGKQVIAIAGEAGAGKTRLIAEWQKHSGKTAAAWLDGRGHAYGQKTHGIWVEVLEQLLGFDANDDQGKRWRKLAECVWQQMATAAPGQLDAYSDQLAYLGRFLTLDLSPQQGLSDRIARMDAAALQLQTRLAICDLLAQAAQEHPLVLVFEDLHWADAASLALLEFVLNRLPDDVHILFCLVFRPLKEHAIWLTWQAIERACADCCTIGLQELADEDGRQLLRNLLKTDRLDPTFQDLVLGAADGNPLYVEEVLHALIEEGVIIQDGETWRVTRDVERIRVPDTLYQIIQSRIDELDFGSPGARRLLWMASVLGETFPEDLLRHLFASTGRSQEEFARHLRELRNAAMLNRVRIESDACETWGYRFQHGLVRQVAYENMLVEKRRACHVWVANWLEEEHKDDLPRYYDALAYHYDQARQQPKAFKYHWLAGQQDAQACANRDAASHLQRALDLAAATGQDDAVLARIHLELGQALVVLSEFNRALAHLTQATDLLQTIPGPEAIFLAARGCYEIGRVHERIGTGEDFAAALRWQQAGLALLPETPTAEAALLHLLGAAVATRQADFERVEQESRRALALAQASAARAEIGLAHRLLGFSARARGDLNLAMSHCQQSIAVCRERADLVGVAKDYANQGVYALEMGDWALAKSAYQGALEIQERVGDRFQAALTRCNLGDLYCHLGEVEQGIKDTRAGLEAFTALASPQGIIFAHAVLATLRWRDGDLAQAKAELLTTRQLIQEHGAPEFEATVGRWLAQVYLQEGNLAQVEAELGALQALDPDMLGVEAEPIQRVRGQLLAAQGKPAEGMQLLYDTAERLEQIGERYEEGRTRLALAGVLAGLAGQEAPAKEQARLARAILAELGARLDAQEADALLTRLSG